MVVKIVLCALLAVPDLPGQGFGNSLIPDAFSVVPNMKSQQSFAFSTAPHRKVLCVTQMC
jgi:hypothetical protein